MKNNLKEFAVFYDHVYNAISEAMNSEVCSKTNISSDGKIYLINNESNNFWDQSLQLIIPESNYSKKFYYFRDGGEFFVLNMTDLYMGKIDIITEMTDRIINAIAENV